jgi:hypothetical protein
VATFGIGLDECQPLERAPQEVQPLPGLAPGEAECGDDVSACQPGLAPGLPDALQQNGNLVSRLRLGFRLAWACPDSAGQIVERGDQFAWRVVGTC